MLTKGCTVEQSAAVIAVGAQQANASGEELHPFSNFANRLPDLEAHLDPGDALPPKHQALTAQQRESQCQHSQTPPSGFPSVLACAKGKL